MQPSRSSILRHEVVSETLVLVTMRPGHGVATAMMISPTEAKRFAWAILADLDPDEAEAASPPDAPYTLPASYGKLGVKSGMPDRIKDSLDRLGEATAAEIASDIRTSRGSVMRACASLRADGLLRKTGAVYSLREDAR